MSDPIQAVPDAVLNDLRQRLRNTRWPSVVEGQGWARGTDLDYLSELVEYWVTDFDWRAQEAALSRFTHERVGVSDVSLHQIHERVADQNAPAVVLLHGWPDSFLRYTKALPLLHTFHRICALSSGLWLLGAADCPRLDSGEDGRRHCRVDDSERL